MKIQIKPINYNYFKSLRNFRVHLRCSSSRFMVAPTRTAGYQGRDGHDRRGDTDEPLFTALSLTKNGLMEFRMAATRMTTLRVSCSSCGKANSRIRRALFHLGGICRPTAQ
jgi:hypothetical protein